MTIEDVVKLTQENVEEEIIKIVDRDGNPVNLEGRNFCNDVMKEKVIKIHAMKKGCLKVWIVNNGGKR